MKQQWDVEEMVEHFALLPPEVSILGRNEPHNHLGKALLLKFFQYEGRFPENKAEIPPDIIEYVAQQLSLSPETINDYKWDGRTIKDHRRTEIMAQLRITNLKGKQILSKDLEYG